MKRDGVAGWKERLGKEMIKREESEALGKDLETWRSEI